MSEQLTYIESYLLILLAKILLKFLFMLRSKLMQLILLIRNFIVYLFGIPEIAQSPTGF